MWKSSDKRLVIDVRSSVEVLLLGSLEGVDAHIPYSGIDSDEWSEYMKAYRSQSNNAFLLCVDELLIQCGLNRNCIITLIASSNRHAIMAANILSVAGYGNVVVKVGRKHDSSFHSDGMGDDCDPNRASQTGYEWSKSMNRQMGGGLH
jgi:rhodanese-related sulfurtransferase